MILKAFPVPFTLYTFLFSIANTHFFCYTFYTDSSKEALINSVLPNKYSILLCLLTAVSRQSSITFYAYRRFLGLDERWQELFMAFYTGKKTLPVLYDTVFKKLMDPEVHRDRLEDCVSSLLGRKVKIVRPAIPQICCSVSTTA